MGQLISTLVFLFMAIWLAYEARNFYIQGNLIKSILVFVGSLLALLATFRFQIQRLVNRFKKW